MPTLSTDRVAGALAEIVREAVEQGQAIDVPELGVFRVEHRSSEIEERGDGTLVVHPPRNEVVFESHAA